MPETAPVKSYMGSKRKKPKKTVMSGYGGGKKKMKKVKSKATSYHQSSH